MSDTMQPTPTPASLPTPRIQKTPWHHAPVHSLIEQGIYIVTAATYQKQHYFRTPDRLQFLHDKLHEFATEYGWQLQAWAILSNHYHIIAVSPDNPTTLSNFIRRLHGTTSRFINMQDNTTGRKIWGQYWDTRLTYERSYLARLHYVHANPVHHGLVLNPTQYKWCSAAHFENEAPTSFCRTVYAMPIDTLNLHDDF